MNPLNHSARKSVFRQQNGMTGPGGHKESASVLTQVSGFLACQEVSLVGLIKVPPGAFRQF